MSQLRLPGLPTLAAVLCILFIQPARCADDDSALRDMETVRLRLKWLHQFQFAGCYAARENGYFAEHGLQVELQEAEPGMSPVQVVLSGQAEYGIGGPEVLQSRLEGSDVVALAVIMQQSPSALICLPESGVRTLEDLQGRNLMIYPGGRSVEIEAMLRSAGIGQRDYIRIEPTEDRLQQLISGKVSALHGYTTNEVIRLRNLGLEPLVFRPEDYGVDFYGDVLFTTERELRDHPGRARAIRESVISGWEFAGANPNEMVGIITRRYSTRKQVPELQMESDAVLPLVSGRYADIGQMSTDRWRRMAEAMQELGVVKDTARLSGLLYTEHELPDNQLRRMRNYVLLGALAGLLLLGLLMFFNMSLREAVRFRTTELTELNQRLSGQLEKNRLVLAELEENRRGYAEAQRIAKVGNWAYDCDTGGLDWSEEVFRIYGLDPGLTPSLADALEVTHEEDRSLLRQALRDAIRDGRAGSIVRRIHYSDGSIGYANTVFEPVINEGGRTVMLRGTVQDVTEIRVAEEARRESEQAYSALFDNSIELIFVVDGKGSLLEVNDNALQRFGFSRDELSLLSLRDITVETEYDRALRGVSEVMAGERRTVLQEFSALTRNGERVWYESAGVRLDREGQPWGVLLVARDITDRKQAESERRQLEAQLRQTQKLEAIGTLAGGIAHDFNNLLFAIRGNAELAITLPDDDENTSECLSEILAASSRAAELVQQILSFARKSEVEMRVVDLNQIFGEVLRLIRATIPANIEIVSELGHGPNMVYGDVTQMHQMMMNLCSNAGYAMREQGGRLTIRMRPFGHAADFGGRVLDPAADYLLLTVEDTGTGISEKVCERIFEPFFTTKGMGEGTGMGLSAVHGIVTSMKGAIEVQSTLGVGTTFSILLPAANPEMYDSPEHRREIPGGTERVLVVDDEASIVRVMYTTLSNLGYDVTACTASLDALERFRRDPAGFDVVISDQSMPGLTGNQLTLELRRLRPEIPVVICSGNNTSESLEEGQRNGVSLFLHKPVERGELARALRSLFDDQGSALISSVKSSSGPVRQA
ncbi:ABC transporter substrate-binding protein [bacterium]|nr:ABC transporter substrate-binding protein [bacterium]